jgi:hypothetical protein
MQIRITDNLGLTKLIFIVFTFQGLDKNIINHPNSLMREQVCQLAFLSEKILHGTPSGIDNSISTYGGMCTFAKGNFRINKLILNFLCRYLFTRAKYVVFFI